jgi:hypothetical protein
MGSPADLIPDDPELSTPNVQAAIVKRAPTDLTDTLAVSIPSFDPLKLEEVHFWMPRGDVLPAEGDAALIAYAEDGEPWLVAFSPAS